MAPMYIFMTKFVFKRVDAAEIGCLDASEIYTDELLRRLKYFEVLLLHNYFYSPFFGSTNLTIYLLLRSSLLAVSQL